MDETDNPTTAGLTIAVAGDKAIIRRDHSQRQGHDHPVRRVTPPL